MSSTPFASNELALALVEQTFGVHNYSMLTKSGTAGTQLQASAEIELLEGTKVEISLTSRGYQFEGNEEVYESIEDALQAVSPRYAEARQQKLFAKLAEVAKSR